MQRGAFRELEELRHLPVRKRLNEMGPDRPDPREERVQAGNEGFQRQAGSAGFPQEGDYASLLVLVTRVA